MEEVKCTECTHANCFIKLCSEATVREIEGHKTTSIYKKGQYIFHEGSPVDGIYLLYSGKVKVLNTGYNGRQQVIRLAKSPDILGHRGFGGTHYAISASAIEDTVICFIENETFNQALKTNIDLTYQMMLFYSEELREAEARMRSLAQMTVREKVADALYVIQETFGKNENGNILLDTPLSRQDIADISGIRAEQVTRMLTEFKKENLIKIIGKQILITNPQKLFQLIAPYYHGHLEFCGA